MKLIERIGAPDREKAYTAMSCCDWYARYKHIDVL